MTKTLVPLSKIGTPFQSPSWRFNAVHHPERFGFSWFCSRREIDAGHLARLINKGVQPAASYAFPAYFREVLPSLPAHLAQMLVKVWNKHYFRDHRHKVNFSSGEVNSIPISWNMSKVKYLNDDFLKRMIYHFFDYKHDQHIAEAIKFHLDPSNEMTRKWINYTIYSKLTDQELAKMWRKSVGFIRAIRQMFFDYSHWPSDKLVHYSLIRQLVVDGEIDEPDFHVFRRIYDLGSLGIKSITDMRGFSKEEQRNMVSFIEATRIDKLLNLNYTCTDAKDAINYNRATADYANTGLKRLEIEQKAELLRLTALRLSREMGVNEDTTMFGEESGLLEELRERARVDHVPKFKSFIDLKAEDIKLVAGGT